MGHPAIASRSVLIGAPVIGAHGIHDSTALKWDDRLPLFITPGAVRPGCRTHFLIIQFVPGAVESHLFIRL
jgi:hypothetical protein